MQRKPPISTWGTKKPSNLIFLSKFGAGKMVQQSKALAAARTWDGVSALTPPPLQLTRPNLSLWPPPYFHTSYIHTHKNKNHSNEKEDKAHLFCLLLSLICVYQQLANIQVQYLFTTTTIMWSHTLLTKMYSGRPLASTLAWNIKPLLNRDGGEVRGWGGRREVREGTKGE